MTDWQNGITIMVPTFRRPDGLQVALDSLRDQRAGDRPIELIIADNAPEGCAREQVSAFAKTAPFEVIYLHVTSPGVSNARNAALAKARGRYIAFLDDDQEAGENWLSTLLETAEKFDAALTFVPTFARIPDRGRQQQYYQRFFSRVGPDMDEGLIDEFFGCGNSLLDRGRCTLPTPAFDPRANDVGGEDDILFSYVMNQGAKVAWSRKAHAFEDVRPHRVTPKYISQRSFAFGQGPSQLAADRRNWTDVARWMGVGVLQLGAYSLAMLGFGAIGHKKWLHYYGRTFEGLGKIFWFGGFRPRLYGQSAVSKEAF